MSNQLFVQSVSEIVNPDALPPSEHTQKNPAALFFEAVKGQVNMEDIPQIDEILAKSDLITNTTELGLYLNEISVLCSSFINTENRLFLYKINIYPHVTDISTGEVVSKIPTQYFLTTEPFRILLDNIVGVCNATVKSIDYWRKDTLKLEKRRFEAETSRNTVRNNRLLLIFQILSILLAISLSMFFLTSADPLGQQKKINQLKLEIIHFQRSLGFGDSTLVTKVDSFAITHKDCVSNKRLLLTGPED